MIAPATPPLLKDLNERTVLETIRARAPISRAEISRHVGISKPTVSLALQSLLDAGLVREATREADGPTYGALFFEPVSEAALVLGLDVGARFLRGSVCDLAGAIRAREDVGLERADAGVVLDLAVALRDRLIAATGLPADRLDGAVVGVPGVSEPRSGEIRLVEAVRGLEGRRFDAELQERLGLRVTIENDVNLAALGEQSHGLGRGIEDFAFLSIGTGLGAGIVLSGALHRGHRGAAGEVDWALGRGLDPETDPCAKAVSAFAARLAAAGGTETTLGPPYAVPDVFTAARHGDDLAMAVVAEEAGRIALHIAPIAAVADVAMVVLGGGIGVNGDLLLAPVREHLASILPYPPQIEVSSLGDAAVLTGALAVGRRAALESVFVNRAARRG